MEKFKPPPDSPPVVVIDPDDQPMWSSTRTIAPTPNYLTQGILDAGGIFLYNTPNEAFKILKDKVVELENQINQGFRNRQAIIKNLERQFDYLNEKIQPTKFLPRTTNSKQRHEFVYKQPSIRNENDKGDVAFIEEDEVKPIPTMPNPSLIESNSPTISPFLKDSTLHIPYTNAKTFVGNVLPNNVCDKELKLFVSVGTGRMTKKDGMGMPQEPYEGWNLNENMVPYNENVYHYLWHPTKIPT
ncbi:hypothetical protein Tco_0331279 [Tanacetum coccineum]